MAKTKITTERLREILTDTIPSCGVFTALTCPDDQTLVVIVEMAAKEWRELSPEWNGRD